MLKVGNRKLHSFILNLYITVDFLKDCLKVIIHEFYLSFELILFFYNLYLFWKLKKQI